MSVISSDGFPQNPVPTIFAEERKAPPPPPPPEKPEGLLISRTTLAIIGSVLFGAALAAAIYFNGLYAKADAQAKDLSKKLELVQKENAALQQRSAQLSQSMEKYIPIERQLDASRREVEKIQTLLATKPAFPTKSRIALDEPLWKEDVEKRLSAHVAKLQKHYSDIANWNPPRTNARPEAPPPGAIVSGQR